MKNMIITAVSLLILLFLGFEVLSESNIVMDSVSLGFSLWKNNIVPSLFPFFLLSEFLIYFGLPEFLSELMKPFMNRFFKMRGICSFVFIMSIFSGFPSNAKYANELLENDLITPEEASKVLLFSHFSNPLFILGTVCTFFLKNKEVGLFLLFCHYIGNFILGLLFRNYHPQTEKNTVSLKKALLDSQHRREKNDKNLGTFFPYAIQKTIQSLLLILGIITTFLVLTSIIDHNINLSPLYQSLLNGCIEMTQGLKYIGLLKIPLKLKVTFAALLLSFGGLSVHMQMFSILNNKVKYFPFLTARILHSLISAVTAYVFFDFFF